MPAAKIMMQDSGRGDRTHFFSAALPVNLFIIKALIMSTELLEFSDRIDELFDPVAAEPDDFWQQLIHLFI